MNVERSRERLGIPHRTAERRGATEASLVLPDRLDRATLGTMSARGDFQVIEPLLEAWIDGEQRLAVSRARGCRVQLSASDRLFRRASARIDLNPLVAWSIRVEGSLRGMRADLARVRSLEVFGSVIDARIVLGCAPGLVRVHVGGSVRGLSLARPRGVPTRVVVRRDPRKSWESPGFAEAETRLELEIEGDARDLELAETDRY
jgi:hypothetical protein